MRKKLFLVMPLVCAIFATAAGRNGNSKECEPSVSYGQGHSVEQMNAGYNIPARYDVKGAWDYYFTGSFIYWQPKEKGLEVTRYKKNETGSVYKGHAVQMDFDFDPGFKVGMGLNSDRDDWNLYLEYTRLTTSNNSHKTITDTSTETMVDYYWAIGAPDLPGTYLMTAKGRWKQYLNLLDLELGRSYYVGTKLTFKPFIGMRAGWLDQKYKAEFLDESNVHLDVHCDSDSWLLGPRAGIDTNWLLGQGFRLFGNFAFSIFYQSFDVKVRNVLPLQTGVTTLEEDTATLDKGYINPNLEAALGFGWGCYFSDEEWHIDIAAGYEFHQFWNQNMIRYLIDFYEADGMAEAADLTYNGLTISLRLDF